MIGTACFVVLALIIYFCFFSSEPKYALLTYNSVSNPDTEDWYFIVTEELQYTGGMTIAFYKIDEHGHGSWHTSRDKDSAWDKNKIVAWTHIPNYYR